MQNSKKLSIIIVNYRSERYLERCIASIYNKLAKEDVEIIVINNDEQEDLEQVSRMFPETNIINLRKNLGFGAANNIGVKKAQAKHLLFLNPDTEIVSVNMDELIGVMMVDPNVGLVGLKIIDEKDVSQEWAIGFSEVNLLNLIKNNIGLGSGRVTGSSSQEEVFWVSGAAFLMPKEVFLAAGGFDENYFLYYEDVDLCKTVRETGKKIQYMPKAVVRHSGGGSQEDKNKQKKDFYASQDYYFKKHHGAAQAGLVRMLRKIFA